MQSHDRNPNTTENPDDETNRPSNDGGEEQPQGESVSPFVPKSLRQLRHDATAIAQAAALAGTPITPEDAWVAAHRQEEERANQHLIDHGRGDLLNDGGSELIASPSPYGVEERLARLDARIADDRRRNEDAVLARAAALDPNDHSENAEYVREVAESIQDHRESAAHSEPLDAPDPATATHAAAEAPSAEPSSTAWRSPAPDPTPEQRLADMPAERVAAARELLRDYPDAVPYDEMQSRGLTLDDVSVVYLADDHQSNVDGPADVTETDPWRAPAAEPWGSPGRQDTDTADDPPAAEAAPPAERLSADAMRFSSRTETLAAEQFAALPADRVAAARAALATLPETFTTADLELLGVTPDEAALVHMHDTATPAEDLPDRADTDPWRAPATEPWQPSGRQEEAGTAGGANADALQELRAAALVVAEDTAREAPGVPGGLHGAVTRAREFLTEQNLDDLSADYDPAVIAAYRTVLRADEADVRGVLSEPDMDTAARAQAHAAHRDLSIDDAMAVDSAGTSRDFEVADSAVTDPWRAPAAEPHRLGADRSADDEPAGTATTEPDGSASISSGRYGATVDPNGRWTTMWFDSAAERATWLHEADFGVRELVEPDGTRHPAALSADGHWGPAASDATPSDRGEEAAHQELDEQAVEPPALDAGVDAVLAGRDPLFPDGMPLESAEALLAAPRVRYLDDPTGAAQQARYAAAEHVVDRQERADAELRTAAAAAPSVEMTRAAELAGLDVAAFVRLPASETAQWLTDAGQQLAVERWTAKHGQAASTTAADTSTQDRQPDPWRPRAAVPQDSGRDATADHPVTPDSEPGHDAEHGTEHVSERDSPARVEEPARGAERSAGTRGADAGASRTDAALSRAEKACSRIDEALAAEERSAAEDRTREMSRRHAREQADESAAQADREPSLDRGGV